jgi:hypothetical protein
MKKTVLALLFILGLVIASTNVSANTVTVILDKVEAAGIEIGAFQLFFYESDGTYQYPVGFNNNTFTGDFDITWAPNPQAPAAGWDYEDVYPFQSVGDIDFATGYAAIAKNDTNPVLTLKDGLLVTLASTNSFFGIDPNNPGNTFFDFFTSAKLANLQITETWQGDNQNITVSQIPIPPAILLLGGGLIGLVAVRRRRS